MKISKDFSVTFYVKPERHTLIVPFLKRCQQKYGNARSSKDGSCVVITLFFDDIPTQKEIDESENRIKASLSLCM
jgi:hypothetical protein